MLPSSALHCWAPWHPSTRTPTTVTPRGWPLARATGLNATIVPSSFPPKTFWTTTSTIDTTKKKRDPKEKQRLARKSQTARGRGFCVDSFYYITSAWQSGRGSKIVHNCVTSSLWFVAITAIFRCLRTMHQTSGTTFAMPRICGILKAITLRSNAAIG